MVICLILQEFFAGRTVFVEYLAVLFFCMERHDKGRELLYTRALYRLLNRVLPVDVCNNMNCLHQSACIFLTTAARSASGMNESDSG